MAVHYKTQGFIFKKEDRQEADRVFSAFTRDFGRVELFAKSIRAIASKLKAGADVFYFSQLSFIQGKNRKTLTDALAIETFNTLAASPEKLEIAGKASRLLDVCINGQEPDEKILQIVVDFFQKLHDGPLPNNHRLAYPYFFWNFVAALGYKPELFWCALCGQKLTIAALYFSSKEGGVLCKNCGPQSFGVTAINADVVKALRIILKPDWSTITKLKIAPQSETLLRHISSAYYHYLDLKKRHE